MNKTRYFAAFLLSVVLIGCGQKPAAKPAVKPLLASEQQLAALPGFAPGATQVEIVDGLVFETANLNAELTLRVLLPSSDSHQPLPVVLFSHGNWSDKDRYDNVLRHWASHGYAVVAPTHLDGRSMLRGIVNSLRYGQMGLIDARVEDLQYLLDHLPELEQQLRAAGHPALSLARENIIVTGHSFGAFSAQQFAGAKAIDLEAGTESLPVRAGQVAAVVAISPPGPMFDIINDRSWEKMTGPVLVTTGTWDSNPQFWPDWRMHLLSHQTAQAGQQYSLVIEGADHYLGNLICRPEREEAPQHQALAMLNTVTLSFMDAYLKADKDAAELIESDHLETLTGGFVTLSRR